MKIKRGQQLQNALSIWKIVYKQGCGVGGKMSDSNSDLSKVSDTDSDSFT